MPNSLGSLSGFQVDDTQDLRELGYNLPPPPPPLVVTELHGSCPRTPEQLLELIKDIERGLARLEKHPERPLPELTIQVRDQLMALADENKVLQLAHGAAILRKLHNLSSDYEFRRHELMETPNYKEARKWYTRIACARPEHFLSEARAALELFKTMDFIRPGLSDGN